MGLVTNDDDPGALTPGPSKSTEHSGYPSTVDVPQGSSRPGQPTVVVQGSRHRPNRVTVWSLDDRELLRQSRDLRDPVIVFLEQSTGSRLGDIGHVLWLGVTTVVIQSLCHGRERAYDVADVADVRQVVPT